MKGEAEWMASMKFDEVKIDSGGYFNDMDAWGAGTSKHGLSYK